MASSEQQCLRFFVMACCFGLLIGLIGCATNNWSKPLFENRTHSKRSQHSTRSYAEDEKSSDEETPATIKQKWDRFWNAGFGSSAGLDPKAREIEKSLGY